MKGLLRLCVMRVCVHSCDFDDDFTVLGCPSCPNGYPCMVSAVQFCCVVRVSACSSLAWLCVAWLYTVWTTTTMPLGVGRGEPPTHECTQYPCVSSL